MAEYVGAIDQGTTSSRFMAFNHSGGEVGRGQHEFEQILPQAGHVEHDPAAIWASVTDSVESARHGGISSSELAAIGVTNQRETTVVWNPKTGEPYYNAIVWQDTRNDRLVTRHQDEGHEEVVKHKAGLPIATYFSGGKLQWLFDNVDGLRAAAQNGEALFGNTDTWVLWNLTGGTDGGVHITDVSNASRTMLMNLETLDWDDELCELFGVPRAMLPEIRPSSDPNYYGVTRADGPFGAEIPLCGDLGDQQAATVGQVCYDVGDGKNTYGTGNFMLLNTGTEVVRSDNGLLTTLGYKFGDDDAIYCLEGAIAVTGSAVQWLRDQLGIISDASESETLAKAVEDTGGVVFVPAFSGLFAPYWDSSARGVLVGLSRFNTKEHIARATLEAVCYQSRDVAEAMNADSGVDLEVLKVDGGMTANDTLMQMQADVLGVPVSRPVVPETTALGAAYAAGLATGFWSNTDEMRENWQEDKRWEPQWSDDQREEGYTRWKKAIERTRDWVDVSA